MNNNMNNDMNNAMDSDMNNAMSTSNVSFTWVKRVTEIGLALIGSKEAKERAVSIMDGDTINTPKLIDLITECAETAGTFVEKNDGKINRADAELIQSLLGKIDAKDAVASVGSDELAAWVKDLVLTVEEQN